MSRGALVSVVVVASLIALVLVGFVVARWRGRAPAAARAPGRRREGLGAGLRSILARRVPSEEDWRAAEELLIRADTGTGAARAIVSRVREAFGPGAEAEALLTREIARTFEGDAPLGLGEGLSVVLVVGVNGTGKTTTIGKLASLLAREGRSVAVAASDTFRAAAVEQLAAWAERAGADLVAQARGADPGAVAFDAVEAAKARGRDVLIVDTAGRIHTRKPLMEELGKVRRVLEKAAGRIDETLLVVDATTGQNGISQARTFLEAVDVTGIALTKLDGTAKGGIVLAIREQLGVPVKLVGTGEGIGDLAPFDPWDFAESLVVG